MALFNRKVKNATSYEYDGIKFRSKMEVAVYRKLKERGIEPEYEKDKIVLIEGFKPLLPWFLDGKTVKGKIRDMTYTPDFRFEKDGMVVYLEVKGFETDRFPLKRKLFLNKLYCEHRNAVFVEIKTINGLIKTLDALNL
jgi:predicted nuclease of restriction endonuclease-like RecB superfamily